MDSIAILDFGSQYSQLIARRVREAQVYCELFPFDAPEAKVLAIHPQAFILSGGPNSVTTRALPTCPSTWCAAGSRCWASATGCTCWPARWADA